MTTSSDSATDRADRVGRIIEMVLAAPITLAIYALPATALFLVLLLAVGGDWRAAFVIGPVVTVAFVVASGVRERMTSHPVLLGLLGGVLLLVPAVTSGNWVQWVLIPSVFVLLLHLASIRR
jgi:hypothetical protein